MELLGIELFLEFLEQGFHLMLGFWNAAIFFLDKFQKLRSDKF